MPLANLSLLVDPGNATRTQPDIGSAWGRSRRWVDAADWQYGRICVGGQITSPADGTVLCGMDYSLDNQATWIRGLVPSTLTITSTAQVIIGEWEPIAPEAIQAGQLWIRSWYESHGAGGTGNASAQVVIALQFLDFQFR